MTSSGSVGSVGSVAGRALLAVALMVGFYILALGIAGVLVWLPYAEFEYTNRVHPKLVLICLIGAGAILWSIVPRADRFEPPGPKLDSVRHPKLFGEIEKVAKARREVTRLGVGGLPLAERV